MNDDIFVWFEKYRPTKVEDCILPDSVLEYLTLLVKMKNLSHLLFHGPPGCGKTTAARAICDEIGLNYMFINASEERGIDTLRTKIINYATTVSLLGGKKVIILDEADNLTQDAQLALRGVMEQFVDNCTFILTANFPNKILDAIHSRAVNVNFTPEKEDIPKLSVKFFKRVCKILETEQIDYNKNVVASLIASDFPDYRRILNTLQRHSTGGHIIDSSILVSKSNGRLDELMANLKDKDFTKMRKWVAESTDIDYARIYRKIYDTLYTYIDGSSIPAAVMILAKYQYQAAFVADQELNLVAALTEIMVECEVK